MEASPVSRGLLIDFMANFLNLTGAEYPALISERGMGALQGKSSLAIFLGNRPALRRLCFPFGTDRAL